MVKRKVNRALSSGDMLEYEAVAEKLREFALDHPIHKTGESLLSTESGFTNFRGLINWGLILLVTFAGRLVLNNFNSYGIIMDPLIWRYIITGEHSRPAGLAFIAFANIFVLTGFLIERFMVRWPLPHFIYLLLVILNLTGSILFPSLIILAKNWSPFFTSPAIMLYIIIFLKLWSYAMVNNWCRKGLKEFARGNPALLYPSGQTIRHPGRTDGAATQQNSPKGLTMTRHLSVVNRTFILDGDDRETPDNVDEPFYIQVTRYPDNLTLSDLYYFMFAPTLCYELNFPRTLAIRKRFLFKRTLEMICLFQVILCLVQQWMIPVLKRSVSPFTRSRWTYIAEHLLAIAIPNHVLWLLGFYATFHSFLNVIAEILRFGDRHFYEDWWNASSIFSFWSAWNIPVHRWCHRHLFKPMLSNGMSHFIAGTVVFFVSAFFHELMVSVPLKMPRMWAFLGMLGQQPYAFLVFKFCRKGGKLGNMAMWLTLIVGQPLALYMYFHDYYVQQYH